MNFLEDAKRIVSGSSRDHAPSTCGPTPPLICDCCEWPMGAHEIVRNPDGSIPGLLVCSLCVEDNLAACQLEMQP